jgi:hypothetical protein
VEMARELTGAIFRKSHVRASPHSNSIGEDERGVEVKPRGHLSRSGN